jgi:hypothetical protein
MKTEKKWKSGEGIRKQRRKEMMRGETIFTSQEAQDQRKDGQRGEKSEQIRKSYEN